MTFRVLTMLCGCVLLAGSAGSQTKTTAWTTPSAEQINAVYPEVEALYFDLHQSPELAMREQQTAAKLADRVKAMGFEVTSGVGGTGIVAVLRNGKGPTVLLRTDMDALPIAEETGVAYASHVVVKSRVPRVRPSSGLTREEVPLRGTAEESSRLQPWVTERKRSRMVK